jgi:hypothetical protein
LLYLNPFMRTDVSSHARCFGHFHISHLVKETTMFSFFRALTDRVKALFATNAAMDFEAELLARDAERRAELHRLADRYDTEGLHGIANHLRQRVDNLSLDRPLAIVLPALDHLGSREQAAPSLPDPTSGNGQTAKLLPLPATTSNASRATTRRKKSR